MVCRDGSASYERILQYHAAVHALLEAGVGLCETARRLGQSLNAVKRYARVTDADQLIRPPQYRRCLVDPFRDHLRQRRAAGPVATTTLLTEIRARGYPGSANLLARYLEQGRAEGVNNKTKLLKRQTYGRAGFALLRQRILLN